MQITSALRVLTKTFQSVEGAQTDRCPSIVIIDASSVREGEPQGTGSLPQLTSAVRPTVLNNQKRNCRVKKASVGGNLGVSMHLI